MKKLIIIHLVLFLSIFTTILLTIHKNSSYIEHLNYYEYIDMPYGDHQRNVLDLCLPKNDTNGLVMFIHGGSWVSGDKKGYSNSIKEWCNNKGYAACAINYRFISGPYNYIDILDDINNALLKVKQIASDKSINLTKVLLTGHSAGGHLSLLYGYSRYESAPIKPTCIVNQSGPTDLNDSNYYINNEFNVNLIYIFSNLLKSLITVSNYQKKSDILALASPISYITPNSIPTITCHGINDDIVPYSNAISLHNKLSENNVSNILITYPNSGHGLENDEDCSKLSDELMNEFANKYLK